MQVNPNELGGLTLKQVEDNQKKYGQNLLPQKPKQSNLSLFISQLKNPLIYILLLSGIVTFLVGDYSDSAIIASTVLINSFLGFIQERKASDALFALKHYITEKVEVVREGKRDTINTADLVPGDIVILGQGSKVPSDGIILKANRLFVDESLLTGESSPLTKDKDAELFMGTTIASGQAVMRVEKTGDETKMGAIALQIQTREEDTPLQKQIKNFSRQLIFIVGSLVLLVLVIGMFYGLSTKDIFITSVALAVSSIPEGLIISLTVVLAIGMQKILKRKALVRKLAAAETLGGVTVICIDKTGTITEGKMEVVQTVGDEKRLAEQIFLANDMDDPIVITGAQWAKKITPKIEDRERLDSIPFSSKSRYFISLHKWSDKANKMFVNGAPEVILEWSHLSEADKNKMRSKIDELTNQGYRLVGLAQKDVAESKVKLEDSDGKDDLEWIGMLAFSDPVRLSVKDAMSKAKAAGIRTIVVTGDYAKTSEYVLAKLGITISEKEIITGEELSHLSVDQLSAKVKEVVLFARTTPDQKLTIVEALKKNGEIVAMMGDGVNDAPALHAADIGIAVGEATDVSKETADLVLLDSNFSTIISAIEEGRGIFDNIRKIIIYLMSDAFTEIIVVLGSIILGFPPALIAVQILWINLASDGFPSLSLTVDPIRKNIMLEPPRPVGVKLVSRWMVILMAIVSLTAGLLALGTFVYIYKLTGDIVIARSMAFITLGIDTLVYVYSIKSLMIPFWKAKMFGNKWLNAAVIVGFSIQILPFATPKLREFFGLSSLSTPYWVGAFSAAFFMFVVIELFKFSYQRRTTRSSPQLL